MFQLISVLVCLIFIITVFGSKQLQDEKCHPSLTLDITNGIKNKTTKQITHENVTYSEKDYYISMNETTNETKILGCLCNIHRCIRKCCPLGQSFTNNICQNSSHHLATNFTVPVHKNTTEIKVSDGHFKYIFGKYCEHNAFQLSPDDGFPEDLHYLQEDGTLYLPKNAEAVIKKQEEFCFDFSENENVSIIALSCFSTAEEMEPSDLYSIGMLISMPFLMVTFFVYACVPELQNIHGKCLMCYVVTLFVAYIFLVSVQLSPGKGTYCVTAPFIIYFAFMVSFMWLNVMCVDICWTFSGRRGFKGSVRQSERKRFIAYSIYAWGVPFAMLCIALGLQFGPNIPNYIIKPRFGEGKCWFADDKALSLYFYGPILLIIVVNLGLFSYTALKIWNVQKDTDQSMKHESQRHGNETDKQRYKLYLKLMLVFGVNWLMEIISWLISGPKWLWYITDMCNALYGVFIFFIFVCKANVWKLVRKRYHVMMGRPYLASTYGPTSSTRSTGISHSTANPPGNGTGPDSFALTSSTAA